MNISHTSHVHFSSQMYDMQRILLLRQNLLKYHQMMAKICLCEFVQVFCFYKTLIPKINILNKYSVIYLKDITYHTLSKSNPASSFLSLANFSFLASFRC